ncbi:arginase family protein [Celeribacter ethanolicus]|uniref:arginase family protein n=1 Tax=Celeribacter ethanolicus TaxID=1758178 RepID=UPI00192E6F20
MLKQHRAAREAIEAESPDRLVVFGGDCSVNLVPFTYLNERYDGDVAILWVVSHPDIMPPHNLSAPTPWSSATCWGRATRICPASCVANLIRPALPMPGRTT